MYKTTVYLPEDVKTELERLAAETGRNEADLIREGVRMVLAQRTPPPPHHGTFDSGQSDLSERVDELLEGFGNR